jgi:hypothetical protein
MMMMKAWKTRGKRHIVVLYKEPHSPSQYRQRSRTIKPFLVALTSPFYRRMVTVWENEIERRRSDYSKIVG